MDDQMNNVKVLLTVIGILAGVAVTGAGMAIRGDWLGSDAAKAVEERIDSRFERLEKRSKEQFRLVLEQLKEIREKLDK